MITNAQIATIGQVVSNELGVSVQALQSGTRQQHIVDARHIAMSLLREHGLTLQRIAGLFHRKDHATVSYACRKVKTKESSDSNFATQMQTLRTTIANQLKGH